MPIPRIIINNYSKVDADLVWLPPNFYIPYHHNHLRLAVHCLLPLKRMRKFQMHAWRISHQRMWLSLTSLLGSMSVILRQYLSGQINIRLWQVSISLTSFLRFWAFSNHAFPSPPFHGDSGSHEMQLCPKDWFSFQSFRWQTVLNVILKRSAKPV